MSENFEDSLLNQSFNMLAIARCDIRQAPSCFELQFGQILSLLKEVDAMRDETAVNESLNRWILLHAEQSTHPNRSE